MKTLGNSNGSVQYVKNLVNWFISDMNFLLLCYNCCNHITVIRCNDGTNIMTVWRYSWTQSDGSYCTKGWSKVSCLDIDELMIHYDMNSSMNCGKISSGSC